MAAAIRDVVDDLPRGLYRADSVRELDRLAIEGAGIAGFTLMRRAGRAATGLLRATWPGVRRLAVLCGAGNNGGDGYIVAAEAAGRGLEVELFSLVEPERLQGDAAAACGLAREAGLEPRLWSGEPLEADVIVDALLGTGLAGPVRSHFQRAIAAINAAPAPVLALDIPSGLCADTGAVLGAAVVATHTVTFIGVKLGLLTGEGRACSGHLHFDDLAVPTQVLAARPADALRLCASELRSSLPPRSRASHKGRYGHVLVVGGDVGMGGAGVLASRAAGRCGAGLVSLATRPEVLPAVIAQCPEIMAHGVLSGQDLEPLLARPSVIAIGPGLGQQPWGEQLLQRVWSVDRPLVVDADALNLLAAQPGRFPHRRAAPWVMTPHPGEAARLLGVGVAEVQRDRPRAALELRDRYGAVVLLKGSGSLIAGADEPLALCPYGNPGMASGGMGDVLSGVVAALLAQGLAPWRAAAQGALLHARAADMAAADGERGLLASDLLPCLRQLVNPGPAV